MNTTCYRRPFEFGIGAITLHADEKMTIFQKNSKILELNNNLNARFCAPNNIDFWYRKIDMTEKQFSKIEKLIFLKIKKKRNSKSEFVQNMNLKFPARSQMNS